MRCKLYLFLLFFSVPVLLSGCIARSSSVDELKQMVADSKVDIVKIYTKLKKISPKSVTVEDLKEAVEKAVEADAKAKESSALVSKDTIKNVAGKVGGIFGIPDSWIQGALSLFLLGAGTVAVKEKKEANRQRKLKNALADMTPEEAKAHKDII